MGLAFKASAVNLLGHLLKVYDNQNLCTRGAEYHAEQNLRLGGTVGFHNQEINLKLIRCGYDLQLISAQICHLNVFIVGLVTEGH